ncbi:ABC transporter ATP-binding protein [Corynebacterium pacaense]|uniref:ABC transporter ATP-binding protein n=1 Tax=Corynebacterium pacaense TaxID=1816684 RepID=UPI0009BC67FD|nr:ABC transporter ATP-binding protein [Corynebacterium pacaense]
MTSRITLTEVGKTYENRNERHVVLDDVSIDIEAGEFISVIGPSGCGKTTLLKIIAGILPYSSGSIEHDDAPVTGPSATRGLVFQQPTLYPWFSVRGNVELAGRYAGRSRKERRERAQHYLDLVNLSDAADKKTYELSGGMQQRAQIARVLAGESPVILMDEPFGALDALTRERLQDELRRIWLETKRTIIFVTHSVEEAVLLSTRILVMGKNPGRIIEDVAIPAELDRNRSDPEFVKLREKFTASVYRAQEAEV